MQKKKACGACTATCWPKTRPCCKCPPSSVSAPKTWDRILGAWCSIWKMPAAAERQPFVPQAPRMGEADAAWLAVASSSDQINRARPCLVAVALRHAHIDGQVRPAREVRDVLEHKAAAPILLRQSIDA